MTSPRDAVGRLRQSGRRRWVITTKSSLIVSHDKQQSRRWTAAAVGGEHECSRVAGRDLWGQRRDIGGSGGDRGLGRRARTPGGPPGNDWLTYHGSYKSWHYSPLDQINADNIKKLQVAWMH